MKKLLLLNNLLMAIAKNDDNLITARVGMPHPRSIKNLLQHDCIKDRLLNEFFNRLSKFHHAHIISGPRGIGKATLVYSFIKELIKRELSHDESDVKKNISMIEEGIHPDMLIIEGLLTEAGLEDEVITIDQIRFINHFASLKSTSLPYKFIIIDSIDKVGVGGSNALLKNLEEPVSGTYIFLICNNLDAMLPTLKSRCSIMNAEKLNYENFISILQLMEKAPMEKEAMEDLFLLSDANLFNAYLLYNYHAVLSYNKLLSDIIDDNQAMPSYFPVLKEMALIKIFVKIIMQRLYYIIVSALSGVNIKTLQAEKSFIEKLFNRKPLIEIIFINYARMLDYFHKWQIYNQEDKNTIAIMVDDLKNALRRC